MKKLRFLATALLGIFGLFSCSSTSTTTTSKNTEFTKTSAAPTLESLKQNPDIVWIGEVYVDYAVNYDSYAKSPAAEEEEMEVLGLKGMNVYKILKYQIANIEAGDNEEHNVFFKLIKDISTIVCYKDEQLTQQLSGKESQEWISSVDTIVTFDPNTFEEIRQVVVNTLNPEDVKFFRVKQIIYYNKKDITFQTIPVAIAPMARQYSYSGALVGVKAVFWMKPHFMDAIPSLSSENISWAKRMYRNLPLKDVKVIKEDYPINKVLDTMIYDLQKNADKVVVGNTLDADGTKKMTAAELKKLSASVDTIITFHPVNLTEKIQVVRNPIAGKTIEHLRLMQDFVWDAKSKQMGIRFVGFKPIVNRYDDNGNFLYAGPVFTLKVGDNK